MNRHRFRFLLGVGVAAAAALLIWSRQVDSRLRSEISELENRRSDLARLQKNNQDLSAVISQLAALRAQAQLAAQPKRPSTPPPVPPGFESLGDLRDVGSAAAKEAFETYLWAIDHGEPETLAKVMILSGTARAEINSAFAKLPAAEQEKYGSPEGMFALLYANANANAPRLTAMQTGDASPAGPAQIVLKTNWQFPGGQVREHPIPLYRTSDGWKVIVPDLKVEALIQSVLEPETPAARPVP